MSTLKKSVLWASRQDPAAMKQASGKITAGSWRMPIFHPKASRNLARLGRVLGIRPEYAHIIAWFEQGSGGLLAPLALWADAYH
jgi:hypothetical protein